MELHTQDIPPSAESPRAPVPTSGSPGVFEQVARRLVERVQHSLDEYALSDVETLVGHLRLHQQELESRNRNLTTVRDELERSKNQLFVLYEHAPVAYFTLDRKAIVTRANAAAGRLLDADRSSLLGTPFLRNIARHDQLKFLQYFQRILTRSRHETCEVRVHLPGSRELFVRLESAVSGSHSSAGEILIAAIDVSAAKESESLFRGLLECAPDAILVLTPSGTIVTANRQAEDLFGRAPSALHGRKVDSLLSGPDAAGNVQKLLSIATSLQAAGSGRSSGTASVHGLEANVVGRDGAERDVEIRLSAFRFNEQLLLSASVRDITDAKRKEKEIESARSEADQANRAKSEFLANMSHEIRTPITAILGYTELLDSEPLSTEPPASGYIDKIQQNASHLLTLINDILDIAKIESGKIQLERVRFRVDEEISKVVSMLEGRAFEKNLKLTIEYENIMPDVIESDPTRLRQILLNLVGNAIKFTPSGEVRLRVRHRGRKIEFRVIDTGCGIRPECVDSIFDPFSQADASTTRKYGGTGLGLAVSRRLARSLGGDVTVEGTCPKLGSTFLAVIDAGVDAATAPEEGLESSHPLTTATIVRHRTRPLERVSVLLADDGEDNRILFKTILGKAGARVETAVNGAEAIEKARQGGYDLILMDLQMPEVDGYTAASTLRECGFDRPILALSAHAMTEARLKGLASGCNAYITKPVSSADLIREVSRWCPPVPPATPSGREPRLSSA